MVKFQVRYRRARVTVEGEKPEGCSACHASGRVELHHYHYAYTTKEVRENPQLAFENGLWLCFPCHMIADAIRKIVWNQDRFAKVHHALMRFSSNPIQYPRRVDQF
jgi:hypothetical protein